MFDVEKFAQKVCAKAFPATYSGDINRWEYNVFDYLGYYEHPPRWLPAPWVKGEDVQYAYPDDGTQHYYTCISNRTADDIVPPNMDTKGWRAIDWPIELKNILKRSQEDYRVMVQWSVTGLDQPQLDSETPVIGVEILVNASQVRALNAFQWALNCLLPGYPQIKLSALFGDVDDDGLVGKNKRVAGRAFRAWRFAVSEDITGMKQLFEAKT